MAYEYQSDEQVSAVLSYNYKSFKEGLSSSYALAHVMTKFNQDGAAEFSSIKPVKYMSASECQEAYINRLNAIGYGNRRNMSETFYIQTMYLLIKAKEI
jgi:hypothetical protein